FNEIKKSFYSVATRLDVLLPGHKKERFLEFYAASALWHINDPLNDWIPHLLRSISKEERETFTAKMSGLLKDLSDDEISLVWDGWLKRYW
ncbi:hypothetical protein, partial [Winogradskyella poriferorum]|uniref:hypothetical protein n=1 Tax=Winogradskyella poriferorum TaxID=307627 RepID=UPI003D65277D